MAKDEDRISPSQALEIGRRLGMPDKQIKAVLEAAVVRMFGATTPAVRMWGAKRPTTVRLGGPRPPDMWDPMTDPDRVRSFQRGDVEEILLLASPELVKIYAHEGQRHPQAARSEQPAPLPAMLPVAATPKPALAATEPRGKTGPRPGARSLPEMRTLELARALLETGEFPAKPKLPTFVDRLVALHPQLVENRQKETVERYLRKHKALDRHSYKIRPITS
jgi:hypothetical protein